MTKNQKSKYFVASAILGLTFLILSYFVNKDVFRTIDYDALIAFQTTFGRFVDLPFSILTLLGFTEITFTMAAIIFTILFFRKRRFFSEIFLIFLINIIEVAGKMIIYHPKPPAVLNRYALDIFFPSSFVVSTNFAFPSGHMARTTFLSIVILYFLLSATKNKMLRVLFIASAVLFILAVFVSRIYLAEHWLSDVIGGLLLGGSLATFAISFW